MNNGDIIYKFFSPARVDYFTEDLLRITQPACLNDPFECVPILPGIEEVVEILEKIQEKQMNEMLKSKKSKFEKKERRNLIERTFKSEITNLRKGKADNIREKYRFATLEKINKIIGILSLTRRWDSSLMWSHYSASHTGFCIGFNSSDNYFQDYSNTLTGDILFRQVKYSDDRIMVAVTEDDKLSSDLLITKSKDWEYEEEERLIVRLSRANKRISNKPYDIFLFKVPHSLIKEVILGANITKPYLELIMDFCSAKAIPVYQSRISELKFDMIKVPL